jgi:hypothetical protein
LVSNEFKLFESGNDTMSIGGYLICENCNGYYHLQDGESPSDFDFCECGGHLNYQEELDIISDNISSDTFESKEEDLDYEEMQQMVINLKNKAEKRKKQFEELSKKVEIQEELLNEIKGSQWTDLKSKKPRPDDRFNLRRNRLENISGNTNIYPFDEKSVMETMKKEEAKLMATVYEKRSRIREKESGTFSSKGFILNVSDSPLKIRLSFMALIALILLLMIVYFYFYY